MTLAREVKPEDCECDPFDLAALGHMTTCPHFEMHSAAESHRPPHPLDELINPDPIYSKAVRTIPDGPFDNVIPTDEVYTYHGHLVVSVAAGDAIMRLENQQVMLGVRSQTAARFLALCRAEACQIRDWFDDIIKFLPIDDDEAGKPIPIRYIQQTEDEDK